MSRLNFNNDQLNLLNKQHQQDPHNQQHQQDPHNQHNQPNQENVYQTRNNPLQTSHSLSSSVSSSISSISNDSSSPQLSQFGNQNNQRRNSIDRNINQQVFSLNQNQLQSANQVTDRCTLATNLSNSKAGSKNSHIRNSCQSFGNLATSSSYPQRVMNMLNQSSDNQINIASSFNHNCTISRIANSNDFSSMSSSNLVNQQVNQQELNQQIQNHVLNNLNTNSSNSNGVYNANYNLNNYDTNQTNSTNIENSLESANGSSNSITSSNANVNEQFNSQFNLNGLQSTFIPNISNISNIANLARLPNGIIVTLNNDGLPILPMDIKSQEAAKIERKKEKNRAAASKCRQKKLENLRKLESENSEIRVRNEQLMKENENLRRECDDLRRKNDEFLQNFNYSHRQLILDVEKTNELKRVKSEKKDENEKD